MPREDGDAHATDPEEAARGSGPRANRKKAFRFLPSSDILLLKEMVKHTPRVAGHGDTLSAWDRVASGVKGVLSSCTADEKASRRRFAALLDAFRRDEMESLRASGTAEDFTEREQLLTDIASLEKADKTEKEKREAERRENASAEVVRDVMAGLRRSRSSDSDSEKPSTPAKRPKRTSTEIIADYLETNAAVRGSRSEEKKQQLDLEARRLALEENRLELDRERNESFITMMSTQMSMMAKLMETITNAKD